MTNPWVRQAVEDMSFLFRVGDARSLEVGEPDTGRLLGLIFKPDYEDVLQRFCEVDMSRLSIRQTTATIPPPMTSTAHEAHTWVAVFSDLPEAICPATFVLAWCASVSFEALRGAR